VIPGGLNFRLTVFIVGMLSSAVGTAAVGDTEIVEYMANKRVQENEVRAGLYGGCKREAQNARD
jgi:hypothetical protein